MVVAQDANEKFWSREDVTVTSPFEHVEDEDNHDDTTRLAHCMYQTMFANHNQ